MGNALNPVRNYQYTMWKGWQGHDEFHEQQFRRICERCTSCLGIVAEGLWEPVYGIVKAEISFEEEAGNEDLRLLHGAEFTEVLPKRCQRFTCIWDNNTDEMVTGVCDSYGGSLYGVCTLKRMCCRYEQDRVSQG